MGDAAEGTSTPWRAAVGSAIGYTRLEAKAQAPHVGLLQGGGEVASACRPSISAGRHVSG